jgi:hypothetical protein
MLDKSDLLAASTPAEFSERLFGWTPYPYQEEVMDAVLLHGVKRVAWVAGRRVGKTETTANIALQLAVTEPGKQVAIFAPTFKQATILSKCVKRLLAGSPYQANVVVDKVDELRLRFGCDARGKPIDSVIFTNSLSGKVRGEGADVLIIDESAFCNSEDYRNKALPFIADRPEAIIIQISTVWSDDDHFTEALKLYPTLPHGMMFRTPTRMKPGVTEERLAEYKRSMLDSEYRREYECEIVPEGGVFNKKALGHCFHEYTAATMATLGKLVPQRQHTYFVGVDWGKKQDRAVVAVVEQATQHKVNPARLVFLQVYEPDPDNATHYTTILEDVKQVAKHVSAQKVIVDEGEGGFQAEVLAKTLGSRLVSFRFTGKSRNWLVDNARTLVELGRLQLPEEPVQLRQAFLNVQRTDMGYEHASRKTKDVFDAVALALSETGLGAQKESVYGRWATRPNGLNM